MRRASPSAMCANREAGARCHQQVQRKNIQYSTGFTLAPGRYHLKFVVRENQTGNMGSFETDIQVPDLKKAPLKLSSVVLASQRTPNAAKTLAARWCATAWSGCPMSRTCSARTSTFICSTRSTIRRRRKEAPAAGASPGLGRREGGPVHVLTSIEFLSGGAKVYETPLVTPMP